VIKRGDTITKRSSSRRETDSRVSRVSVAVSGETSPLRAAAGVSVGDVDARVSSIYSGAPQLFSRTLRLDLKGKFSGKIDR